MVKKLTIVLLTIAVAAMLFIPVVANGKPGHERKIVMLNDGVNPSALNGLLKRFAPDSILVKELPSINGAAVLLPPRAAAILAARPEVALVEDDRLVSIVGKPSSTVTQPPQDMPWGVDRIDADNAWTTSTATGVKVAVIDTGIDLDHPDLVGNVVATGGINTINPRKKPDDDNGHGSHVAGTIAAVNNDKGVIGVGHNAKLYAVKALGASGIGYTSDIIEGLNWCVNNGMNVVNMSFGSSYDDPALHKAITDASVAGIVLVAAAGNKGPGDDTVSYPARYSEVIAVAATGKNSDGSDYIASFSSRGPEVDIAAPGVSIPSTYKSGGYATWSGTSMATPHVVGAVALVLEDNPDLTPSQVMGMIRDTAEPLPNVTDPNAKGAGLIDAEALVNYTP